MSRPGAAELAGGVYGVAIGGLFAGESMFSRQRDASKVALAFLIDRLRERGYQLFDIQFRTEHTGRLGAIEIPRKAYLARLRGRGGADDFRLRADPRVALRPQPRRWDLPA